MYVKAEPTTDVNRNTEWFTYPGVWITYILMVFISWLIILSVFGCSPGMAWSFVHLSHFLLGSLMGVLFYSWWILEDQVPCQCVRDLNKQLHD